MAWPQSLLAQQCWAICSISTHCRLCSAASTPGPSPLALHNLKHNALPFPGPSQGETQRTYVYTHCVLCRWDATSPLSGSPSSLESGNSGGASAVSPYDVTCEMLMQQHEQQQQQQQQQVLVAPLRGPCVDKAAVAWQLDVLQPAASASKGGA